MGSLQYAIFLSSLSGLAELNKVVAIRGLLIELTDSFQFKSFVFVIE